MSEATLDDGFAVFRPNARDTSVDYDTLIEYKTSTTLPQTAKNQLIFQVPASGNYLDLKNSFFLFRLQCYKEVAGVETPLTDADSILTSNYFATAIIQHLDVLVNSTLVSSSNAMYPYRGYLDRLLTWSPGISERFGSFGFYNYDHHPNERDKLGIDYYPEILNKKEFELACPVYSDLFRQDRYLLSNTTLRLEITLSSDEFVFIKKEGVATAPKFRVLEASLHIRNIKPTPELELAHIDLLRSNLAIFPLKHISLRQLVIPQGVNTISFPDPLFNKLPSRVICFFLPGNVNSYTVNPFFFHHYNCSRFSLAVDGVEKPVRSSNLNFEDGKKRVLLQQLQSLMALGVYNNVGHTLCFDRNMFDDYFINCYSLDSIDGSIDTNLSRSGSLRIDIDFKEQTPEPINLVILSVENSLLSLTQSRQVLFDYIP
jgi:hypothetical protein